MKINDNGEIEHLQPPIYHGNPVDEHGSLVITDWGYDIIFKIFEESGIMTKRIDIKDIGTGIFAEYIDVLVTRKK